MFMLGVNHNEMAMHMHISYMSYVFFQVPQHHMYMIILSFARTFVRCYHTHPISRTRQVDRLLYLARFCLSICVADFVTAESSPLTQFRCLPRLNWPHQDDSVRRPSIRPHLDGEGEER
jgi:hypothetical protein